MTIYFTGDQHFGHWTSDERNIIKYTNRPFSTIEEMDEALIAEWNKIVKKDDTIYHLGDFCLGDEDMARPYFHRLGGCIHMLKCEFHHDRRWLPPTDTCLAKDYWVRFLPPVYVLEYPHSYNAPAPIVLCHYPFAIWDRKHYNSLYLHAHSHGNYQGEGKILDVGVDNVNKIWGAYRPVSLDEVREFMEGR